MLKIIKIYCLLLQAVQDRGIYLSMVSKKESVMFAIPHKTLGSDKSVLNSVFPQINPVDCVRNDSMLFCNEPAKSFNRLFVIEMAEINYIASEHRFLF